MRKRGRKRIEREKQVSRLAYPLPQGWRLG